MSGGGRKDIAAVKTAADRFRLILRIFQLHRLNILSQMREGITQDAIVRPDKVIAPAFHRDCVALAPHPGVNHDAENGPRREVLITVQQGESGFPHILRSNGVRDVHDLGSRTDIQNHGFHRSNINVFLPKVRQ